MKRKSKSKLKEISLPMKFNPGLSKYEPDLPLKKSKAKEISYRKINWWAYWYVLIFILILIGEVTYFLVKYFLKGGI